MEQNIKTLDIPKAHEVIAEAQKGFHFTPPKKIEIPFDKLRDKIESVTHELCLYSCLYDSLWEREKQKLLEKLRKDNAQIKHDQREKRRVVERTKQIRGLKGQDKAVYNKLGLTPVEFREFMRDALNEMLNNS